MRQPAGTLLPTGVAARRDEESRRWMARAVDQRAKGPVAATTGRVAVAEGDLLPEASASERESSNAAQRTRRRRSVSDPAEDGACPSRVASADTSLPAKHVAVKSVA